MNLENIFLNLYFINIETIGELPLNTVFQFISYGGGRALTARIVEFETQELNERFRSKIGQNVQLPLKSCGIVPKNSVLCAGYEVLIKYTYPGEYTKLVPNKLVVDFSNREKVKFPKSLLTLLGYKDTEKETYEMDIISPIKGGIYVVQGYKEKCFLLKKEGEDIFLSKEDSERFILLVSDFMNLERMSHELVISNIPNATKIDRISYTQGFKLEMIPKFDNKEEYFKSKKVPPEILDQIFRNEQVHEPAFEEAEVDHIQENQEPTITLENAEEALATRDGADFIVRQDRLDRRVFTNGTRIIS